MSSGELIELSADNKYLFNDFLFDKLSAETFSKINFDNIAFVAVASSGAMGWAGASQFFTKDGKKYMLTAECIESTEVVDAFFETLHKPEWRSCNLGVGNRLYMKSEYYPQFIAEKGRLNLDKPNKVYRDWCKIADEILSKKRAHG
ncbi:MAG: hypothetical protein IJ660_03405 [Alphaproteobacteria bacterium]|nr:hypothetical protein [Alphaproteobacteria bacterium]